MVGRAVCLLRLHTSESRSCAESVRDLTDIQRQSALQGDGGIAGETAQACPKMS